MLTVLPMLVTVVDAPAVESPQSTAECTAALTAAYEGITYAGQSGTTQADCTTAAAQYELDMLATWSASFAATLGDEFENACIASVQGTPDEHTEDDVARRFCSP